MLRKTLMQVLAGSKRVRKKGANGRPKAPQEQEHAALRPCRLRVPYTR